MARTFLFIYLETLPFALLNTVKNEVVVHMAIVFLVTYGFVGLETVSIELDNPFGDDDNDFDNMGMAEVRTSCMGLGFALGNEIAFIAG